MLSVADIAHMRRRHSGLVMESSVFERNNQIKTIHFLIYYIHKRTIEFTSINKIGLDTEQRNI